MAFDMQSNPPCCFATVTVVCGVFTLANADVVTAAGLSTSITHGVLIIAVKSKN